MQKIKQGVSSLGFVIIGFLMALIGVSNPNSAEALAENMKERLAFGLRNSHIEIYFVTDWYCPSCQKVEPLIEKMYPKMRARATVYFIDYPIHKKSMNYTPYNIAFLINNKSQYFKGRQMLSEMTEQTETPKDEEVARAAQKKGIVFIELPFIDIKNGMDFFDKIAEEYKLSATPVLIFKNLDNKKVIKLEGRDEITEEKINEALEKIEKN